MMVDYREWFKQLTEHEQPHDWQSDLAAVNEPRSRLVRIPTGLGKTEGVLSAWSYHHVELVLSSLLINSDIREQMCTEAERLFQRLGFTD